MGRSQHLAGRIARLLTRRYLLALGVIFAVALAGQVAVQWALLAQAHDARVINLAGRQRMLSQQLVRSVLALDHLPAAEAAALRRETASALASWESVHRGLASGDAGLNLPANRSGQVGRWLADLEPAYRDFHALVLRGLAGQRVDLTQLLTAQNRYLTGQEAVVWELDHESGARVAFLRLLELLLFAILAVAVIAEALLVFRPAVRRVRSSILEHGQAEERVLAEHVAEATTDLQRRIGQDLHDGVGQELTGVSFQVQALRQRLADHATAPLVNDIQTQLQASIGQIRALAHLLTPPAAEAGTFGPALRELAANTSRAYGLDCTCAWDDELPLPSDPEAGTHLYRIAQEAIANAARHGGARTIALIGRAQGDGAELTIDDDGCGFDTRAVTGGGLGLRSMAWRAQRLGATLSIRPLTGGGTQVAVRW